MYSETEQRFATAMMRPDAQRRQECVFRAFEQVVWQAKRLGIQDIFLLGSLASPVLRDYRPHDDCDIFVPRKDEFDKLKQALKYRENRPYVLHGSSLHYLSNPGNGAVVEGRYGTPIAELDTGIVWKYKQPLWTRLFMDDSMIMPPSALSGPNDKRSWNGVVARYVHDEYNWLIKSQSPYPKDQLDAHRLSEQGLDHERIGQILAEINSVGGSLMLPPRLIKIVRGFGFWNMPDCDYRLLHGLGAH